MPTTAWAIKGFMEILAFVSDRHEFYSHVSYIRKPRLSGVFLGNERVRINEVSLYSFDNHKEMML